MCLASIQGQVQDWLNRDSNQWADDLNGPHCTRAFPFNIPNLHGAANQFNLYSEVNRGYGTFYEVWTNWDITDPQQRRYQLAIDVGLYPSQVAPRIRINGESLRDEGYEVRIFFRSANRNHNIIRPTQDQADRFVNICANLKQYGFKDNTQFVGGRFDYVRVFHKPVTFENIKNDLAPYVGQYHEGEGGQHLKPYISEIILNL